MSTTTLSANNDFYYVGIGASAGGQDALCEFFTHLPPDTPAAYFVITHLARYHESRLSEIIGRYTTMPVKRVDRPMQVVKGAVYLLIENNYMVINELGLVVQRRLDWEIINKAVDTFFISLAKRCGQKAVGIILSGGGHDGVAGAIEITRHGGKVLVQDPETSHFDNMPNAVIAKDHPKAILRPSVLATKVVELIM